MFHPRFTLYIAAASASFAMLSCQDALATVLPFEMTTFPGVVLGGYESTYASYGDNVTATTAPGPGVTYSYAMGNGFTPNITVDYSHSPPGPVGSAGHSLTSAQGGWSDPVDYLHYQDTVSFWYTFTPTGVFGVDVNSFAIDLFAGTGTLNWKLRQGSTLGPIFASGTETALLASDPDRIVTIANGNFIGTVVLEIDFSGTSNVGNIGIDDLNFDQISVPEPSTFALLSVGAIGLAVRTRRRRTAT